MKNNLVGLVVGIVCAIVIIGMVLVPFIDNVSAETRTYTNEGVPYATPDDDTHTIVVSYDGTDFGITVDDEVSEVPDLTLYGSATLVYCENINIRLNSTGTITGEGKNASGTTGGYSIGTVTEDATVTITVSGTDVTGGSYSFADARAFICPSGDYVLCSNPCVDSTSTIMIIGGVTTITGIGSIAITGIGTIDDFTVTKVRGNGTVGDVTINTTTIDGNLVQVDSIVVTMTYSDTDYSLTYTYFLAPSEIVYDNPDYIGDVEATLAVLIPLFLILAVLVAATYTVMRNRDY